MRQVAVESAANGIVITDRNGVIEWVNLAFTQITGYTFEEARGRTPRLLRSGMHPVSFYKDLWETILSGKPWRGVMNNQRKDGALYAEEMTVTPVMNPKGEITRFIAINNDITERMMLEKLHEEMLHSLIHDLRNPLGNISLSLEMMARAGEVDDVLLQIARNSTRQMQGMVGSILDIHRLEAGHLIMKPEAIAIYDLFE